MKRMLLPPRRLHYAARRLILLLSDEFSCLNSALTADIGNSQLTAVSREVKKKIRQNIRFIILKCKEIRAPFVFASFSSEPKLVQNFLKKKKKERERTHFAQRVIGMTLMLIMTR